MYIQKYILLITTSKQDDAHPLKNRFGNLLGGSRITHGIKV